MIFDSFLLVVRFCGATFSCNWFRSERGAFLMNAIDAILYCTTMEEPLCSLSIFYFYLSILLFVLPVGLFCLFPCPTSCLLSRCLSSLLLGCFMSYYHNYLGRECFSSRCCFVFLWLIFSLALLSLWNCLHCFLSILLHSTVVTLFLFIL